MYSSDLFSGQVALVTGGAGGIGRAVSIALATHGAQVIAADRVAFEPPCAGVQCVSLDVTRRADVLRCMDDAVARLGRLDILVNVAGIVSLGNAETLAEAEWDRVIDINLKGTFLCCQAAIGHMKRSGGGRIVNLGSVIGKNGGNPRPWLDPREQERASNVAYGVSKAGVHCMTAFLAKELAAANITVNAVAPGPVASAMTSNFPQTLRDLIPVGRMGAADEIAAAVLFLASPRSGFVTGEIMDVNGGIWCD
ncbi:MULTISPECIES: SDR family NAD(P)-dependent oxidoreductase [unclassified Achromobacter]|uniref:SDR family NAD(P)-dependent oxidoreductase n=1 Tax=unclassified Achromobacter TaxID=2626865 RepID=UPI000B51800B|nr:MULTISPECIES: SDR family NAD(P)-dependent oxidoreductase [unclassified Achromobacter]OWT72800.1 sugar dehydrogenase [Achromobacter sp. HZ34]OWT74019.1 sugar dehydrogenase [Achromobacter sp. HZ28]